VDIVLACIISIILVFSGVLHPVATVVDDCVIFYECHYAPCTKMERHLRQFDVCQRCQAARLVTALAVCLSALGLL